MARVFRFLFLILFLLFPVALAVVLVLGSQTPSLSLLKVSYSKLQDWENGGHEVAFQAFLKSCEKLVSRPGFLTPEEFRTEAYARAYQDVCAKAKEGETFYSASAKAARSFFEEAFTPYKMRMGWSGAGKITGYYEPLIETSFEAGPDYRYPLFAAPDDQITLNLSEFREGQEGTIIGRLQGKRLRPYYTRKDINEGALQGRGLEILYVKDPVDVYFLQVQGSGRARLPDGTIIGVGYAGKNGHANTLAGRILVQSGEMSVEEVSMQSIRQWFNDNPDRVFEILHQDDSYVFFHITGGDGPFGSSGAVLTPEHSLAVDPRFIPMGVPVYVAGAVPTYGGSDPEELEDFRSLLIAQDTGGAIRGAIRGDIFWGQGDKAAYMAGHMNNKARFTLLLPNGALGDEE